MNNKSRTLINIIGLPLIISSILLGGYYFGVFIFLVIILGTKEYIDLLNKHSINPSSRLLYFGQLILILLSLFYLGLDSMFGKVKIILPVMLITPLLISFIAMIMEIFKKSSTPLFNISTTVFGFIWVGVFINSLIFLRQEAGAILTLVIFLSLWTCDTFAFFFGKHFGKTKIMPDVSPNKTVLGSISGLIGSILLLVILSYFSVIELSITQSFILALITGGISQFGDFFESALKRELNIKDTSNILRGHGGVLDRFDSLSIIAPLLLLFIHLIK
ncbi:MAG: hypothetical protein CMD65_00260 [Gammaproteobacteria bacterium]|nr:hypothetical protein [Gammaproteobacteria bacterium]